jgi:hypothetical protein
MLHTIEDAGAKCDWPLRIVVVDDLSHPDISRALLSGHVHSSILGFYIDPY